MRLAQLYRGVSSLLDQAPPTACTRKAVFACVLLSIIKPNFILMLDTRLFVSKTSIFDAPLPRKIRTKFRMVSVLHIQMADCVQVSLVLLLQNPLLGGWTALDVVSSVSCLALVMGIATNVHDLKNSYTEKYKGQALELTSTNVSAI